MSRLKLQEGELYRFTFVQQSGNYQWYEWTISAVFVCRQRDQHKDEIVLSGRPLFGTTQIPVKDTRGVQPAREVQRPKRLPGAVSPE